MNVSTVLLMVLVTVACVLGWFAAGTITARITYVRLEGKVNPNGLALAVVFWPFALGLELLGLSVRLASLPTASQRREQQRLREQADRERLNAEYLRVRAEAERLGLPLHEAASLTESRASTHDGWKGYA